MQLQDSEQELNTPSSSLCGRRTPSQGGVQVQLGQPPKKVPTQRRREEEKEKKEVAETEREAPASCSTDVNPGVKTRHAFRRQVVAAAHRLHSVLCHLPAVRSSGFLQHRAAGGGQAAPWNGNAEAGVPEPELRQRRVPRTLSGQSADGQQVRRLRPQELLRDFKLGPGILHVLRQHSGHHRRWVQAERQNKVF